MGDSNIAMQEWQKYHAAIKQHGLDNINEGGQVLSVWHLPEFGYKPYMEDAFFTGFFRGYDYGDISLRNVFDKLQESNNMEVWVQLRKIRGRYKKKEKCDEVPKAWKKYHKEIKRNKLDDKSGWSIWHTGKSHIPYMEDAFYRGFYAGKDVGMELPNKMLNYCWKKNEELAKILDSMLVEEFSEKAVDKEEESC